MSEGFLCNLLSISQKSEIQILVSKNKHGKMVANIYGFKKKSMIICEEIVSLLSTDYTTFRIWIVKVMDIRRHPLSGDRSQTAVPLM